MTAYPVGDVLAQIVTLKDGAGAVVKPARRNAVALGVDGDHVPALAVAHRIANDFGDIGGVAHINAGLVAPADDHIPLGDALSAPRRGSSGRAGAG